MQLLSDTAFAECQFCKCAASFEDFEARIAIDSGGHAPIDGV
jgi:hypothetical protein